MLLSAPLALFSRINRNALIVGNVVFFHVALLWAVQSGLMRRAIEVIVPAEILVEFIEPAAPQVTPPRPVPPKPIVIKQTLAPAMPTRIKAVEPLPLAIADPTPSPAAPLGVIAPAAVLAPVAAAPAVAAPPAPMAKLISLPAETACARTPHGAEFPGE